jgi:hypothetical protein
MVTAQNDYAFETASLAGDGLAFRRNNLAQRNVSVVELDKAHLPRPVIFPFIAGNLQNASRSIEILLDRTRLPKTLPLQLALDDDGRAFPLVDMRPTTPVFEQNEADIVFLERTMIEGTFSGRRGVLTLGKGSRFACSPKKKIGDVIVQGGTVSLRDNKRFVEICQDLAVIRLEKQPNQQCPLALHSTIPAEARIGDSFAIKIMQRDDRGQMVGGATVVYIVGPSLVRQ